jgi:hypothetical protein
MGNSICLVYGEEGATAVGEFVKYMVGDHREMVMKLFREERLIP